MMAGIWGGMYVQHGEKSQDYLIYTNKLVIVVSIYVGRKVGWLLS